jgi:hypothetical protein
MMLSQLTNVLNRSLFVGAFALAGVAVWEKLTNILGFTLSFLGGYAPSDLLELSAVALLFVIALQLREMKHTHLGDAGN